MQTHLSDFQRHVLQGQTLCRPPKIKILENRRNSLCFQELTKFGNYTDLIPLPLKMLDNQVPSYFQTQIAYSARIFLRTTISHCLPVSP